MRIFLVTLLLVVLACGLIFYYAFKIEPFRLVTESFEYPSSVLQKPLRIVYFSDTHFGKWYPESRAETVVDEINRLDADIVIFGGDLIDNYNRDQETLNMDEIVDALKSIKAKYGKYAVFGNHDYGGGAEYPYRQIMKKSGFKLLVNESVKIKGTKLTLYGFDDLLFGNPEDPKEGFAEGTILLSHEPDRVSEIEQSHNHLLLSGHSHGGQIYVPLLTEYYLPEGTSSYVRGMYESQGSNEAIDVYVSRGIGVTGLPLRLFSVPEITVCDLIPKTSS